MAIARAKAIPAAAPKAQRTLAPKARKPAMLPKSDGHAGVKAYIASLEPWQAGVGLMLLGLSRH